MNACFFNTPAHNGNDILPVRLGMRRDVRLACFGCRTHISESGFLRIVERRVATVEVAQDRRRFVPTWMRNLVAVDRTDHVR